jgi:hypothetical protein
MIYTFSSDLLSRTFFGEKITDILTPWSITINLNQEIIIVEKRNSYLIGVDKKVIPLKNIRKIEIDEHLCGSNIYFKVYGGSVIAKCLSKKDARTIYELCKSKIGSKKGLEIS